MPMFSKPVCRSSSLSQLEIMTSQFTTQGCKFQSLSEHIPIHEFLACVAGPIFRNLLLWLAWGSFRFCQYLYLFMEWSFCLHPVCFSLHYGMWALLIIHTGDCISRLSSLCTGKWRGQWLRDLGKWRTAPGIPMKPPDECSSPRQCLQCLGIDAASCRQQVLAHGQL